MKLKLKLEYRCYPVWIYENGKFIDNDLPIDANNYDDVDKTLCEIQNEFDKTFIDDGKVFRYIGFSNQQKLMVAGLLENVEQLLKKQFEIENCINLNNL